MMASSSASTADGIAAGFCAIVGYLFYFWRVLRSNPGNKLIEFGTITMIVFFAMVPLALIPGLVERIPNWIILLYFCLVVLLCFTTLFFLAHGSGVRSSAAKDMDAEWERLAS
jgi:hypothetical protein